MFNTKKSIKIKTRISNSKKTIQEIKEDKRITRLKKNQKK